MIYHLNLIIIPITLVCLLKGPQQQQQPRRRRRRRRKKMNLQEGTPVCYFSLLQIDSSSLVVVCGGVVGRLRKISLFFSHLKRPPSRQSPCASLLI